MNGLFEFSLAPSSVRFVLPKSLYDSDFLVDLVALAKGHIIEWLMSCKNKQPMASYVYNPVPVLSEATCQLHLLIEKESMSFEITRLEEEEMHTLPPDSSGPSEQAGGGRAGGGGGEQELRNGDLFQGIVNIVGALLDRTRSAPSSLRAVLSHHKANMMIYSGKERLFYVIDPQLVKPDFVSYFHEVYLKINSETSQRILEDSQTPPGESSHAKQQDEEEEEFVQLGYVISGYVVRGLVSKTVNHSFEACEYCEVEESFIKDAYIRGSSQWRELNDAEYSQFVEGEEGEVGMGYECGEAGEAGEADESDERDEADEAGDVDGYYKIIAGRNRYKRPRHGQGDEEEEEEELDEVEEMNYAQTLKDFYDSYYADRG